MLQTQRNFLGMILSALEICQKPQQIGLDPEGTIGNGMKFF